MRIRTMKKYLLSMILVIGLVGLVFGQYTLNWANYSLINPGSDITRGAVYNPQTDHVLVATRFNGTNVYILSAASGDTIGRMNTEGISGGTYPINLIAIADDGKIYVCNLSAPQFTPGSTFKIYRFENESAAPELIFENALDNERYGDSFAAVGSGENLYFYSSGYQSDKLIVLKANASGVIEVHNKITLPSINSARHGISPVSPGGNLWINGAGDTYPPPRLITNTGAIIAQIPDSLASAGGTCTIKHLNLGKYNIVVVINGSLSSTVRSVRYFEDELGSISFDYFGGNSDSLMLAYNGTTIVNNQNSSASIDYDSRRHSLILVNGVNSVASVSLNELIRATTPRDSVWEISVDGSKDFFPTDHVGSSNGRDMYFTWSSGKIFAGFSGNTLIDPTLKNRLYWAFDTDPDGDNGSTTPPEDAGGVTSLPFKADLVIMTESYTAPDYMIGQIYKWDGSQWQQNVPGNYDYRGNNAAQGVLAYSSAGDTSFTEVAVIKNDAGIGTNFTKLSMMAYIAESGSSGEVVCAFPDINPVGNGVAFKAWYYMDELGSGWFPTDTSYVHVRGEGVSSIGEDNLIIAKEFKLFANYPNPFNPTTAISYQLSALSQVDLSIYNLLGQKVTTLVSEKQAAGRHTVEWNAAGYVSGIYFYKLTVDGRSIATRKMILVK